MDVIQIIEIFAVALGLGNVYFLAKQKIIAWPLGLAAVSLYAYIFYQSHLFSDFISHLIFIVLNLYGWWFWLYGVRDKKEVPVSLLSNPMRWFWGFFVLFISIIWGFLMQTYTSAEFAYLDAFTTVASLVAQLLLAKKKLENWIIWIVVDIVAIQIYVFKGLYLTAGLYFVFLLLCISGFIKWKRSMISENN